MSKNLSGLVPNIRPIAIFSCYMLLASSLTFSIIRTIIWKFRFYKASKSNIAAKLGVFTTLATLSLTTTWYYMFSFFAWSYNTWASQTVTKPIGLELGNWLRDNKLFEQAWDSASSSPQRYWWTQQIFLFATLFSLLLGREGKRRNILHLWAFMLLGQIVAISFASNLFFLVALCSPVEATTRGTHELKSSRSSWSVLSALSLLVNFICIYLVPEIVGTSYFLPVLALPHLLLFMPLYFQGDESSETSPFFKTLLHATVIFSVGLQAKATQDVLGSSIGIKSIPRALYEHPAVSSVGWDVIFCWLSYGIWATLVGLQ